MLLHSSAISLFTYLSLLLQRKKPTTHILKSATEDLEKRLAKRVMIPERLRDISSISVFDLESSDNFKNTKTLYVGTGSYKEHPDETAE